MNTGAWVKRAGLAAIALAVLSAASGAAPREEGHDTLLRNSLYEEQLRWNASADQTITPAKVLRWMRGLRGAAVFSAPSPAEFQPIVNVYNTQVRVIAAIAYKF